MTITEIELLFDLCLPLFQQNSYNFKDDDQGPPNGFGPFGLRLGVPKGFKPSRLHQHVQDVWYFSTLLLHWCRRWRRLRRRQRFRLLVHAHGRAHNTGSKSHMRCRPFRNYQVRNRDQNIIEIIHSHYYRPNVFGVLTDLQSSSLKGKTIASPSFSEGVSFIRFPVTLDKIHSVLPHVFRLWLGYFKRQLRHRTGRQQRWRGLYLGSHNVRFVN